MSSLVIFEQVFGAQQVVGVSGFSSFSSFYFVGLGWFVVCVGVVLIFFISNLRYNGQSSLVMYKIKIQFSYKLLYVFFLGGT